MELTTAAQLALNTALGQALPGIRERCDGLFAEQDFSLPSRERADLIVEGIRGLRRELWALCGVGRNSRGIPGFIDGPLILPIRLVNFRLRAAFLYAKSNFEPVDADPDDDPVDEANRGGPETDFQSNLNTLAYLIEMDQVEEMFRNRETAERVARALGSLMSTTHDHIKRWNAAAGPKDPEMPNCCVICLTSWDEQADIVRLPCHFTHVLHKDCTRELFLTDLKCPLCRKEVPFSYQ